MNKALQDMAQEISQSLVLEMVRQQDVKRSASAGTIDLLLQYLAEEVVKRLKQEDTSNGPFDEDLEARLQKAESKLEKLVIGEQDSDEGEAAGTESSFPNLKYAKPKYKNIESILKYVESDQDKGGVKLVIMNFND